MQKGKNGFLRSFMNMHENYYFDVREERNGRICEMMKRKMLGKKERERKRKEDEDYRRCIAESLKMKLFKVFSAISKSFKNSSSSHTHTYNLFHALIIRREARYEKISSFFDTSCDKM